ncbi:hypothetical protein DNTS_014876 [Danionella cerebrum]|uniref:FZ domain-containing protein n=1 Tax=Danionella cerebrum TaxID=2873325 RepID=A0A553RC97_9TELE|nr:hypothetical protein DNTS_014876 [Danionella translucida]
MPGYVRFIILFMLSNKRRSVIFAFESSPLQQDSALVLLEERIYGHVKERHSTDGCTMDLLWVLHSMLTVCMAINMEAAGSHSTFTCEPITLRMCQGLAYNSTFMPNLLNHYDQQTAALAMEPQRQD